MHDIRLSKEDLEGIVIALQMRANFIQTGNIVLSANDANDRKLPVKALTDDQMRLVLSIKDTISNLQKMQMNHVNARIVGL